MNPASDKQKNLLNSLGIKYPTDITSKEASVLISENLEKQDNANSGKSVPRVDIQTFIIRQTCLKAAAESRIWNDTQMILRAAEDFERWVLR